MVKVLRLEQLLNIEREIALNLIPLAKATVLRLWQPENAPSPIEVTPLGIEMPVRPALEKAQLPIDFTLPGIVILARFVHSENACSPIDVTPMGMVTLVRSVYPAKALSAIAVTGLPSWVAGIITIAAFAVPLETDHCFP
jgi:hypothetical protein